MIDTQQIRDSFTLKDDRNASFAHDTLQITLGEIDRLRAALTEALDGWESSEGYQGGTGMAPTPGEPRSLRYARIDKLRTLVPK